MTNDSTRRHAPLQSGASRAAARRSVRLAARALRQFAAVPLLVVGFFCALAALSILADQEHVAGLDTARRAVGDVIGKDAATSTLQAIAGGLVTVTSITFSVLLLAVQQTASSLSPVVFDQWVRRKSNQVFLGFFVGLAIFAYVVMAAVQDNTPPILGAAIATIMTVVAMLILLALVYTTVDQMRPESVVRLIHDRTLQARERETHLVRRTKRQPTSPFPVRAVYASSTTGYLNGVNLGVLERAVATAADVEICLHFGIGDFIAFGETIATIRAADDGQAEKAADATRAALLIGRRRDLDYDATTGIDDLGNIAWTNGSSSRHNPEVARRALDELADIALRWLPEPDAADDPLPIVYPDNDVERVLEVLFSLIVVAHESEQHIAAARVLKVYRRLIERTSGEVRERLCDDLEAASGLLEEIPASPVLQRVRRELETSLRNGGS